MNNVMLPYFVGEVHIYSTRLQKLAETKTNYEIYVTTQIRLDLYTAVWTISPQRVNITQVRNTL